MESLCVVTGQPGALQRCQGAGLSRAGERNGEKRLSGGGAFQPYLPEGAGLRAAQEALFTPRDDKDERNTVSAAAAAAAEPKFVSEHGNALARKVGADARKSSTQRSSQRRVKH